MAILNSWTNDNKYFITFFSSFFLLGIEKFTSSTHNLISDPWISQIQALFFFALRLTIWWRSMCLFALNGKKVIFSLIRFGVDQSTELFFLMRFHPFYYIFFPLSKSNWEIILKNPNKCSMISVQIENENKQKLREK